MYTIQINETQRAILEELLVKAYEGQDAFPQSAPENEGALLRDMFIELPKDEKEMQEVHGHNPGSIVHGFCL